MDRLEKVIKGLECCIWKEEDGKCEQCPYYIEFCINKDPYQLKDDALALLKEYKSIKYDMKCNMCEYYQGVHEVPGAAPCSFWKIGGVMWYDCCKRFNRYK